MTNKVNEANTQKIGMLPSTAQGKLFEIHVKGQLDQSWSDWLDGLDVKLLDNGEMILFGHIGDQAALMGTLNKLYSLNLTLLSLSKVDQKE